MAARVVQCLNDAFFPATFHINWSEMGAIWPYEADLVRLFRQCRFLSDVILTMRVPVDTLLNIHKAVVAEKRGMHLHLFALTNT